MESKQAFYSDLRDYGFETAFSSKEEYTKLLTTLAWMYKYDKGDIVLIYAQKPDATACAEFEFWNKRFGRYVKRGSKGIGLLRDGYKLKYVFDVSDTGAREHSRQVKLWDLNEENESYVEQTLKENHNLKSEKSFLDSIEEIAHEYVENHEDEIINYFPGNIENYGNREYNDSRKKEFIQAVTASVKYVSTVRSRKENHISDKDFGWIQRISSVGYQSLFLEMVVQTSKQVLRELEMAVRNYEKERSLNHERTELHTGRGLSVPGSRVPGEALRTPREVRDDASDVSGEPQEEGIRQPSDHEPIAGLPASDRRPGERDVEETDSGRTESESGTGQEQGSDRMGTPHDEIERQSGGDSAQRHSVQLSLFFPTEDEQIESIDRAESEKLSAFSIGDEVLDSFLINGGNNEDTRLRVVAEFSKNKGLESNAQFLSKLYHNGNGLTLNGTDYAVWYDEDGIHAVKGRSVRNASTTQLIEWSTAAQRIESLLAEGKYARNVELEEASGYERKQIAEKIWYIHQDLSDVARENYLTVVSNLNVSGFPEQTKELATLLGEPIGRRVIQNQYHEMLLEYQRNPDSMRFGYPKPTEEIETRISDLSLPRTKYVSAMTEQPAVSGFITEDELDDVIGYGSGFVNGRTRILHYFNQKHTSDEQVAFLKQEYGQGGHSDAVSHLPSSWVEHDAKGLRIRKKGCESLNLSWITVAKRIQDLIHKGRYIDETKPEIQEPEQVEKKEEVITPEIVSPEEVTQEEEPEEIIPAEIVETEPEPEPVITVEPTMEVDPQNFCITDDNLGAGGSKEKFRNNIAAIRMLQKLEKENRNALPEEQEVLSKYVGWGGLADAFDKTKSAWANEYEELKGLLSEEEYESARGSTLNAHYTSPTIIRAIYDAVGNIGFRSGNILEPSMGIGNFFGMLPSEMAESKLYGVELDPISGRIAQKLYPKADVKIAGFETTKHQDFFDLAVGNVPFGNYKVHDREYDKLNFSIHNYFFAKALNQVRPGGIVAFVTTRYTMDSKNEAARRYMAQRAELLGAIRLPNTAFKANAGTEVVSDILFLQKRDRPIDIDDTWVGRGYTEDGQELNQYFIDHPEMVLGDLQTVTGPHGDELTVMPRTDRPLSEQLEEAIRNIHGTYTVEELIQDDESKTEYETIPADPDVKNYSYTEYDGKIYFRENSVMKLCDYNEKNKQRARGMIHLRGIMNHLIDLQLEDYSDEEIHQCQKELSEAYDAFVKDNGLVNSRENERAFINDSSYYLLCSLENLDEDGRLKSKADIFTKRTIRPERHVTSVDTPIEALGVCIAEKGKVDLPFMSALLGTPGEYKTIRDDLKGVIFKDPEDADEEAEEVGWKTSDDYLSGDVRRKLRTAKTYAEGNPDYEINVQALTRVQPKELDASEISVRLGSTWVDKEYIQDFMEETFETPYYLRRAIQVRYSPLTSTWQIEGKSTPSMNDVAAYVKYGTKRANAYRILEETLNLKDIRIMDTIETPDGRKITQLNKNETMLAQQKQQAIKDAFQDWIWKSPRRREELVQKYNVLFNSTKPREYDGSHIQFGGMNPEISLYDYQRNAIAHIMYGGNTLLAHEVGAGKTFEMIAAAMESKRLGLCKKPLFVVPNHLTLQWASDFLKLYPSANLLVADKKDFTGPNRKKFCARIATGEYDGIIIGHSQFLKIPISVERQERQITDQIDEIEASIEELKYRRGENFSIKQMEKTKKSLKARLDKLMASDSKDDVVTFEQLGVDRLFVDESHSFKNLYIVTKMRNVAGIANSEAQKSMDMFMKCRYMDELTGGRGVIFATGTPISNSMTEMYTLQRYLQYSSLENKGLSNFDCWASTFGETNTSLELAPEGNKYRAKTRFSRFFNLSELINMFKEVADIKTADELNLPVPEAIRENVALEPSELQLEMVEELSERATKVHNREVDPQTDNMLKITSDGRKIGLDQRLMNPLLPDDPNSKVNVCVENVWKFYKAGEDKKLTQLIFCDMSTPKKEADFTIYEDIKKKLVAKGIPEEEIKFIHDADSETKKKDLFAKVRSGAVRIMIGSTDKMGVGTNVQDRIIAMHHLDCGWRPADMVQRNGRGIRRGNMNSKVYIFNYVTKKTFDAYLYQMLENKQTFISQIMTSKSPLRSYDDVDDKVLSYAAVKALCAGNPLIKEKMELDIAVNKLNSLKASYRSQQFHLQDQIYKLFPHQIEVQKELIQNYDKDLRIVDEHPVVKDGFCGIQINGVGYADKEEAGKALLEACKKIKGSERTDIGSYRGFRMELMFDAFDHEYRLYLKGNASHKVILGTDARGNLTRMDNCLHGIADRRVNADMTVEDLEKQMASAREELKKPFPQEEELEQKNKRLTELNTILKEDNGPGGTVEETKGSLLYGLKKHQEDIQNAEKQTKKDRKDEPVL